MVYILFFGEILEFDVNKGNFICGVNNGYFWVDFVNGIGLFMIKWLGLLDGLVSDDDGYY